MASNEKNLIGVYQCHPEDDIKNLKIRVKVWKSDKNEEEVYDFKWQEKVFSVRELEKYKDVTEANASNDHEKRCKKLLDQWKQMRHKMLKDHRLYSLIDDEIALESEEMDRLTDYEDEKLTATEVAFREAQRTQSDDAVGQQRNAATQSAASVLTSKLDREQFLRQFFTAPRLQRMRLMFDYRPVLRGEQPAVPAPDPEADGGQSEEQQPDTTQKLLCTITYDPRDRMLSLQPDFTKHPLIVGNWRYTIEDISTKMSEAERNRILSQEKERIKLKSESKQILREIDFEMPSQPLRVLIRGEIMAAKHFEYDHLYVHFFLDLTPDWFVAQATGLSGTTQICSTKVEEVEDVAHFAYPFEFELFYERLVPPGEDDYTFPRWPVMYFEVMSQDSWTRHRTEGYAYITLPDTPGPHEFRLQCWRPTGNSVVCELRRFFIGGTPELEDSTFANVPTDFDGTHLSKFGFNTETTGELTVRLHSIHQSARLAELRASAAGGVAAGSMVHGAGGGKFPGSFGGAAGPSYLDLHRALNRYRAARTQLVMVQKASSTSLMMSLQQQQLISGGSGGADTPPQPAPRRRQSSVAGDPDDDADDDGQQRRGVSFGGDTLTAEYMRQIQAREE